MVGARPQFIKAAPVSNAIRRAGHEECLVHTGQHYDPNMSQVFFEELGLREPDVNLGVGAGPHGQQTGRMLNLVEERLLEDKPDWVIIYGDTNSTLAAALAAAKLGIDMAHVEAGLRSFNRKMPEEINRVVSDRLSQLLFCPSRAAVENLRREGIAEGVFEVGDVMLDAIRTFLPLLEERPSPLEALGLKAREYILATVHRAENTDEPRRLKGILECLEATEQKVVFPLHPRTSKALACNGLRVPDNVQVVEPVGYLAMLALEKDARAILTDSGGVQKEALWLAVPCLTLRDETEWVETVEHGWNHIVGVSPERVRDALRVPPPSGEFPQLYGEGNASHEIVRALEEYA